MNASKKKRAERNADNTNVTSAAVPSTTRPLGVRIAWRIDAEAEGRGRSEGSSEGDSDMEEDKGVDGDGATAGNLREDYAA